MSRLLVLVLLVAACHDAPRKNPFDPALTPGVELVSASIDSTRGVVDLEWTQYSGQQPFGEYLVLRAILELAAVDTVARITNASLTSFTDTTVSIYQDYLYRVSVVNQAGFEVESTELPTGTLDIKATSLVSVRADSLKGAVDLTWRRYTGPRFEGYEIRRVVFGEEEILIETLDQVTDTTYSDADVLPNVTYSYAVVALVDGRAQRSEGVPVHYVLPAVEMRPVTFISRTARAELEWVSYAGPRFVEYAIYRKTPGLVEQEIATIGDLAIGTYTDSLLDGNTDYTYRIEVRTEWPDITTDSNEVSGSIFPLDQTIDLPSINDARVRALALGLDETDQIYLATTTILTTTAGTMQQGVRILFPEATTYRSYLSGFTPHKLSPIFITVSRDRVYLTFRKQELDGGEIVVAAIDAERALAWTRVIAAGGEDPVGIYVDQDGEHANAAGENEVLMVDSLGEVYFLSQDGAALEPSSKIRDGLEGEPVQHVVVGQDSGPGELDLFYLLVPEKDSNHIIGRSRVRRDLWGGSSEFGDGVGIEGGRTLTPLRVAYDARENRLVVVEALGRLQLLRADVDSASPRFITKWGRFGADSGAFSFSPPTAVAVIVDSQSRILVADSANDRGRIQVFVP